LIAQADLLQPLEVFLQQSLRAWAAARANASNTPSLSPQPGSNGSSASHPAGQQHHQAERFKGPEAAQVLPPGSWVEVVGRLGALAECDPSLRVRPMVMQPLLAAAVTELAWFQGNAVALAACFRAAASVQGFTGGDAQVRVVSCCVRVSNATPGLPLPL
jgi:hypothetical protein